MANAGRKIEDPAQLESEMSALNSGGQKGNKRDWDMGDGGGFWTLPRKAGLCCGVTLLVLIFISVLMASSMHTIDEGTVGIYFVQGALREGISKPGVNWKVPFVTRVEKVTVRPRTDSLPPIETVTKDGITNSFTNIQVLSDVRLNMLVPLIKKFGMEFRKALIFDRIYEELRTFCAKHTVDEVYNTKFQDIVEDVQTNVEDSIARLGMDGIKILNLVIPKPEIPKDIAQNYMKVKVQWTEQLVASQQQKTETIKKETESIKAVLDAEREKKVLAIDVQKEILRKEGEAKLSALENDILKQREQNKADVENYKKTKAAEGNLKLYTKDYVQLEIAKAMSANTKFFFSGETSPLGAVLAKIFDKE